MANGGGSPVRGAAKQASQAQQADHTGRALPQSFTQGIEARVKRPRKGGYDDGKRVPSDRDVSKWAADVGGRKGRRYVPVGALVVPTAMTQLVKAPLEAVGWIRRSQPRVHRYCPLGLSGNRPPSELRMAIHVTPVAAAAFDAAARDGCGALPPQLAKITALLESGKAQWHSGLRLGDSVDAGGMGGQWHLSKKDLARLRSKNQQQQQQSEAPGGFRFVELFAGIGGFRVALEPLGGRCMWASEIGEEERQTYYQNFGSFPASDITQCPSRSVPPHQLLTAGFPCQSFCQAGLRTGFNDARGELFFEIVRIARQHRPPVLLLENVPHLVEIDEGCVMRSERQLASTHTHPHWRACMFVCARECECGYAVCLTRMAAFRAALGGKGVVVRFPTT